MKGDRIIYKVNELDFIEKNCTLPRAELTERFNRKFNRDLSVNNISALCKRKRWLTGRTGCFDRGKSPWNKGKKGYMGSNRTSFKKGHRPHNATHVGDERVTTDGYVKVKIAEPNMWEHKHRLVWQQSHGEITEGNVIIFKDGNPLNCDCDNLLMVSRFELSRLNKIGYKNADGGIKPSLLALAKIQTLIKEKSERLT